MLIATLERLRCPACRRQLTLRAFEEETVECGSAARPSHGRSEQVVKEGVILCDVCHIWYPIANYVPVMLPFSTTFHTHFASRQAAHFGRLAGYGPPHGQPFPGERSVQDTFTDEWNQAHEDDLTFIYTMDDLRQLNQQVWLRWIDATKTPITSVLDVGCGLGRESEALQSIIPGAEVFGVDLNFALLRSGPQYKARTDIHLVIASLFALPFAPESFDLVYSQGVIHHTYSTRTAFEAIAAFARPNGHVFIWVYGVDDRLLGIVPRLRWSLEAVVRPLVSRAPRVARDAFFIVLTSVLHPLRKALVRHKTQWQWRNTNHDLRDWLSPRYAHRHGYNEVLRWFEDLGLRVVDVQSPTAYQRVFGRRLWGVGMTGRRL